MSDNNSGPQSASTQIKPLPYEGRACSRRDTFVARERQHLLTITVLANVRSSSSSAQQRSLSPRWVLSLPHRARHCLFHRVIAAHGAESEGKSNSPLGLK